MYCRSALQHKPSAWCWGRLKGRLSVKWRKWHATQIKGVHSWTNVPRFRWVFWVGVWSVLLYLCKNPYGVHLPAGKLGHCATDAAKLHQWEFVLLVNHSTRSACSPQESPRALLTFCFGPGLCILTQEMWFGQRACVCAWLPGQAQQEKTEADSLAPGADTCLWETWSKSL